MNKENKPETKFETGQIVRGGRVDGYWLLTENGDLYICTFEDMRKVEPREKINYKSFKGFPEEKILVYNTEVSPSNESKTPDDS